MGWPNKEELRRRLGHAQQEKEEGWRVASKLREEWFTARRRLEAAMRLARRHLANHGGACRCPDCEDAYATLGIRPKPLQETLCV